VISGGSTGVDGELPLIGIMNGGGIRENKIFADTDPGTEPDEFVSELDVRQVLPFGNELAVVKEVSTQQLVNFLENAVSKVVNADTTGGLDPQRQGSGTGRFAQVSGLSFTYNLNGTALVLDTETINKDAEGNDVSGTARTFEVLQAGNRVRNITLEDGTVLFQNGEIVTDTLLNIAMLNFSAEGGDQYFWDFEQSVELLGVEDDEMLLNYMTNVLGLNGKISMAEYGVLGERIQVSAVPVPAALPLFLGAIGALAAFGRRRANNA
jgi:5'-nucleotidase